MVSAGTLFVQVGRVARARWQRRRRCLGDVRGAGGGLSLEEKMRALPWCAAGCVLLVISSPSRAVKTALVSDLGPRAWFWNRLGYTIPRGERPAGRGGVEEASVCAVRPPVLRQRGLAAAGEARWSLRFVGSRCSLPAARGPP